MQRTSISPGPLAALQANVALLGRIVERIRGEFRTNDPHIGKAILPLLDTAAAVVATNAAEPTATVADELAALKGTLGDLLADYDPASSEPSFALGAAHEKLGLLYAPLDKALMAARAMGLEPSRPVGYLAGETGVPAQALDRRAIDALIARLDRIEAQIDGVLVEIQPERAPSAQQVGLVTYFVAKMRSHLGLARLELGIKRSVDLDALARAVSGMADLTRDFVESTRNMLVKISDAVRTKARSIGKATSRVVKNLRVVVKRYGRRRLDTASPATPVPVETAENHSNRHTSANAFERDDLTRIDGIGKPKAHILNVHGVNRYVEIAAWSAADIDRLSRVLNDNKAVLARWMSEAQTLASGNRTAFSRIKDEIDLGLAETSLPAATGETTSAHGSTSLEEKLSHAIYAHYRLEKDLGKFHPEVADALDVVGRLELLQRDFSAAEATYRRVLKIREHTKGADHTSVSTALNRLATIARATGRLVDAERLLRNSLTIRSDALGSDHPHVAHILHDLAVVLSQAGRMDEARQLADKAYRIFSAHYGEADRSTISARNLALSGLGSSPIDRTNSSDGSTSNGS